MAANAPMSTETRAYVALGANLGNVKSALQRAVAAIGEAQGCRVLALSRWYRTEAIGPGAQPDYLNGVAAIATTLEPLALLELLLEIEIAAGRERTGRWAARTLDLDLLLYGELVLRSARLALPHPRLVERNFVVYPLNDVAPELALPDGRRVAALRTSLGERGIVASFATLEQADE